VTEPKKLSVTVRDLLVEVDHLVAKGLVGTASSILEDFLDDEGEHPLVLRGLARLRMLQGKPQDAVPLLKRSLALSEAAKKPEPLALSRTIPTVSVHEDSSLCKADIAIIEEVADEVHAKRSYYDTETEGVVPDLFKLSHKSEEQLSGTTKSPNNHFVESLQEVIPDKVSRPDGLQVEENCYQLDENVYFDNEIPLSEESQVGFKSNPEFEAEIGSSDEWEFEDDDDDVVDVDWIEDTIHSKNHTNTGTEDTYEYAWEIFEPEGIEFDEEISTAESLTVRTDTKLTRFERARQIALSLGNEYGWDEAGIHLLTKIFYRYWWSAAQVSLRREMAAGLTPLELELAEQARKLWFHYPEFSEDLKTTGELTYKFLHLSWPNALALIRSFGCYPDIAEVERFLVDLYDHWRYKRSLMRKFTSFSSYLAYRLGRIRDTLIGHPWMSFETEDYGFQDWDAEEMEERVLNRQLSEELRDMGIDALAS